LKFNDLSGELVRRDPVHGGFPPPTGQTALAAAGVSMLRLQSCRL
jgi:hypothetical protein